MAGGFQTITEADIDGLRAKLGEKRPVTDPFNEYAGKDAIRHFVHGIGDANPLFTDEVYARNTRYGGLIAPPCFLFSMIGWNYPRGLPGVHGMWAGAEFECFLPVRVNDRVTAVVYLSKIEEKHGKFAGRTILQEWTNDFTNQDNKSVATLKQWSIRTERETAKKKNKLGATRSPNYSDDEIKSIETACLDEKLRGATPRFWEDVGVGDELSQLVKGPLTVTDMVAWKIGWGNRPFTFAHRQAIEYRKKHPAVTIINRLGVPDMPECVHWDSDFARQVGVPAAYDFGPQRCSWLGQMLTNWMGDDGVIKNLRVELRGFNLIGDTTWCLGKVTEKRIDSNEFLVHCEIWAENQRKEKLAKGEATLRLPSREQNRWPIDLFEY